MSGAKYSYGKPKGKGSKGKGLAISQPATHPWPRPEGAKFSLPDTSLPVHSDDAWDQSDAYYYNNWLDITVEPTRFACQTTLRNLGLFQGVSDVLASAQLTDLISQTDALYPDLVRQCLASVKLTFTNPKKPIASEGTLSFFLHGEKYAITIPDFCQVYGFDSTAETIKLPHRLPVCNAFWEFIAHGQYYSRSASQSSIRNPVLRIATKALSILLFAREDTSKVRMDELVLLYNAVRDLLSLEQGLSSPFEVDVNMGAILAGVIADKRTRTGPGKSERIGSLLTRLFEHFGVDLGTSTCNEETRLMDSTFLISCGILADSTIYRFMSRDDHVLFCRLPQPSLTDLSGAANVGFTPGTAYLCTETGAAIQEESTPTGAPAPTTFLDADEEEDLAEETTDVQRSKANIRRPYRSEYLLRDISDDPEEGEYRRWMVDSTKKNNGLLRRILFMLQKSCSSPSATATAPSTSAVPPAAPPTSDPSPSARPTRASKRHRTSTATDAEHTSD